MTDTQTVADKTDAKTDTASTEDKGAQDKDEKVVDHLAEYDEEIDGDADKQTDKKPDAKTEAKPQGEVKDSRVDGLIAAFNKRDLASAVTAVRGDFTADEVDDEFIETYILTQDRKKPGLGKAWDNRFENPAGWEKAQASMAKDFAATYGKRLRKIDADATEDKAVVADAVRRGGKDRASEGAAPVYGRMTDGQFQAEKDKLFG